ncbi:MAG: phytanoyl-CoA dioxygenase family protein [Acidimicrobiia bacterium]
MTITTWLPTDQDVAFYREHGWFVAPQVFADDEIDAATEAAWRFYERPDRRLDHSTGFSNWTPADGYDTVRNNEFVSLQHDALRAVAWSERIGVIAARLAGTDEIRLLDDQLVYKPPSMPASEVGWHADHAYWGTCSSNNLITAWVPFHDVDEDRATLVVVDGSHRWGGIEHSRYFNDPDLQAYSARWGSERGGITEVPLRLRKGQVSFHHCWTLHASYANRSDRYRLAMAVHLQDGANTYCEAFRADGRPVQIFDEALCRRLPDGRPDFADPDVFPALWPPNERSYP